MAFRVPLFCAAFVLMFHNVCHSNIYKPHSLEHSNQTSIQGLIIVSPYKAGVAVFTPNCPTPSWLPSAELYKVRLAAILAVRSGRYIYRPSSRRRRCHSIVAALLLMSGIESNPGPNVPAKSTCVTVGLINARSMVKNGTLIEDMIGEHNLDIAAITETWVPSAALDVIKFAAVPDGYAVLHE